MRAEEFGVRRYPDVREMVERERPGLVSVCLPNKDTHTRANQFERLRA